MSFSYRYEQSLFTTFTFISMAFILLFLLDKATAAPIYQRGDMSAQLLDSYYCDSQLELITDGTQSKLKQGRINEALKYQSSAILGKNCPTFVNGINDCWSMAAAADGMSFPANPGAGNPSDRQRIEFLTSPFKKGKVYEFTWLTYLDPVTGSTEMFTHLWQLFGDSGPTATLTIRNSEASIERETGDPGILAKIPLDDFKGKPIRHEMTVDFSSTDGSMDYIMIDVDNDKQLLTANFSGYIGKEPYLKTGLYRTLNDQVTIGRFYVGDFEMNELRN